MKKLDDVHATNHLSLAGVHQDVRPATAWRRGAVLLSGAVLALSLSCGASATQTTRAPSPKLAIERVGDNEPEEPATPARPTPVSAANTPTTGGSAAPSDEEHEETATPARPTPVTAANTPTTSGSTAPGDEEHEETATPTRPTPVSAANTPATGGSAAGGDEEHEETATPGPAANRPTSGSGGSPTSTGGAANGEEAEEAEEAATPGPASSGTSATGPAAGGSSGGSGTANEAESGGIDQFITDTMKEHNIPGLAALVIKGNQVVMAKGYGYADVASKSPVSADTDFLISSCSKAIGAVTLMQLYDQKKFGLDDDINNYLPFAARNPNFPQTPITPRQLLTHSSSLARDYEGTVEAVKPGDPTVSLSEFYKSFFASGTPYYTDKNFDNAAPGSAYEYSNTGAALWAYLAEAIGGQPFYQLSQQSLLSALGMTNSGWRLSDVNASTLATLYDDRDGQLVAVPAYSYIDYPSGSVRTSANQLAKFLTMFMNGGQYNGAQILSQATVAEMQKRQIPQLDNGQGLGWHYSKAGNDDVIGHDGEDTGSSCYMYFRPSDNTGVIILMNVRDENESADGAIAPRLFNLSSTGR